MRLNTLNSSLVLLLTFLAFLPIPVHAQPTVNIYYVVPGGAGSEDCSSWENACDLNMDTLANIIHGGEMWVKAGVYRPVNNDYRDGSFRLKSGLALYGGFAGNETARDQRQWTVNQTFLSGAIGTIESMDNSYHVVRADSGVDDSAVLDGFYILNGYIDAYVSATDRHGAGIYLEFSSPTLANLEIYGNTTYYYGGGIASVGGSPVLNNVKVSFNVAQEGAGVFISSGSPSLHNMQITANYATKNGGGLSLGGAGNPSLQDVEISNNTSDQYGGGAACYQGSPIFRRVTFIHNTANSGAGFYEDQCESEVTDSVFQENYGSGLSIYYNFTGSRYTNVTFLKNNGGGVNISYASYPTFVNTIFSGNTISGDGGGLSSSSTFTMTNAIFVGNSASSDGGGMYNAMGSHPTLINVTFSGNYAPDYGPAIANNGNSDPIIRNSILWGNTPAGEPIGNWDGASIAIVTDSMVEGGYTGAGNLNLDPKFVELPDDGTDDQWGTDDDDYGNLHLKIDSPAIDMGNNSWLPADITDLDDDSNTTETIPFDLDGLPRRSDVGTRPDRAGMTPPVVDMGAYESQIRIYLPLVIH